VRDTLALIAKRLTRFEVHLKDERGPKGGVDIRATVERPGLRVCGPMRPIMTPPTSPQADLGASLSRWLRYSS
jgi:hypothetical protein